MMNPYLRGSERSGSNYASAPQGLSSTAPASADVSLQGPPPGMSSAFGSYTTGGSNHRQPSPPSGAPQMSGLAAPVTHFDEEVFVLVRQMDREEVQQPLGVAVASGLIGTARCVSVRLTDPRDPFFLYSMTLSEDDFGKFKENHELHVDWNGFPQDLISMLSGALPMRPSPAHPAPQLGAPPHAEQSSHHQHQMPAAGTAVLSFFAPTGSQEGTLRILERTAFRSLEHLRLQLTKQGDVGQKHYLAERFKYFEAEYHAVCRGRHEDTGRLSKQLEETQAQLTEVEVQRDAMSKKLAREVAAVESAKNQELSALKDSHMADVQRLYAQMEADRHATDAKLSEIQQTHSEQDSRQQAELNASSERVRQLESERKELRSELAIAKETLEANAAELLRLRETRDELSAYQKQATRSIAQQELKEATLTERNHHFEAMCKERTEELASLRKQYDTQREYAESMKQELERARAEASKSDGQMGRARQLMTQQQQREKALTERSEALQSRVQNLESLLREKQQSVDRGQNESETYKERLEDARAKLSGLQDQLRESEAAKAKLDEQLKRNEEAMLHMTRLNSTSGPRVWSGGGAASASFTYGGMSRHGSVTAGATGGAGAATAGSMASLPGLHKEFARGSSDAPLQANLVANAAVQEQRRGGGTPAPAPGMGSTASFAQPLAQPLAHQRPAGSSPSAFATTADSTQFSTFEPKQDIGARHGKPLPTSTYFPCEE